MKSSNEYCTTHGSYQMYAPCGHEAKKWISVGESFPNCPTCGALAAWTLRYETDRWGDKSYSYQVPGNPYEAMTVNERLFEAGVMDLFYEAARRCDKDAMTGILLQVGMTLPGAERIADDIIAREGRQ
jgi:hypothetical protein